MPQPRTPVVVVDPGYWLEHPDELIESLRTAAWISEHDRGDDTIVLTSEKTVLLHDPAYWAGHMEELLDGLRRGVEITREHADMDFGHYVDIDGVLGRAFEQPDTDRSHDDEGREL